MTEYLYKDLTEKIIKCFYKVHDELGYGFVEAIYEKALIIELEAVTQLLKIHEVQLVNYLKVTKIEIGLLVNFGEKLNFKRKIVKNK